MSLQAEPVGPGKGQTIRIGPLSDIRIVAVEQYGAGPFATVALADLGAEVIKIEDPRVGGDVGRYVPPFNFEDDSLFFQSFNRNKRSIDLDINSSAGRKVFEDLVSVSDAVFSNLRGDVPESLKIRYEDLRHLNPAIVCCSLTGFGMTGPRRAEPGYDYILQGLAGWMDLAGEPGGPPVKSGLSLVDYSGGLVAALSMMAALHAAKRDGQGTDCDVSLYDNAISLLAYVGTWHLTAGYTPAKTRHSAHPSLVPFQNFETSDGWIVVGCAKEKFWERLVDAIGLPELRLDDRFKDFPSRGVNRDELLPILEAHFAKRTTQEWLSVLNPVGVPCAPVNTLEEAFADPQIEARQLIIETEHPHFGKIRQPAGAVRVGPPGNDRPTYRGAPSRNQDSQYVLSELIGYSEEQVTAMGEQGAFG